MKKSAKARKVIHIGKRDSLTGRFHDWDTKPSQKSIDSIERFGAKYSVALSRLAKR